MSYINLMRARLDPHNIENININSFPILSQAGGDLQQDRMIKTKWRTFNRALWNSYQAANIINVEDKTKTVIKALINPNKLKPDYDDKILSVDYKYGFKCGDIFKWKETDSYWIIYLQDLTELAYFRGNIRKCSYQIKWMSDNNIYTTYAAIQGPVETKINFIQKHDISVDIPNYSLTIFLPKNEHTLSYFQRYAKFYLQDDDTCWRVEAVDSFSTPGIIQINAVEYYVNETTDDISNGIVDGLLDKSFENNSDIKGETFIRPKVKYYYSCDNVLGKWSIDGNYPVVLEINKNDPNTIQLQWTENYSGSFNLICGNSSKTITVKSLF